MSGSDLLFEHVADYPGDPILTLNEVFREDTRPHKVNLGVGVYLDDTGQLPLMAAVREAERRILGRAAPKPYLPMSGNAEYRLAVQALIFGPESDVVRQGRVATIQTVGGSGALRLGGDFLKVAYPESDVWVSDPTWDNHRGLLGGCGFRIRAYPYYDELTGGFDAERMLAILDKMPAQSIVLLHACCHNPTGVDPTDEQWSAIVEVLARRRLIPFVDMAYQGFGRGLHEDARLLEILTDKGVSFLVANSFSKNLSLYGERCGALSVVCADAAQAKRVLGQLQAAVRRNYSSPPAHGALIVAEVLCDAALRQEWIAELGSMRERITAMRTGLRHALEALRPDDDFAFITRQRGMFSYTGLNATQVNKLKNDSAIYLLRSGRACMTGLIPSNLQRVAKAMADVFPAPSLQTY